MTELCPTCGQAVHVVSSGEGTSHYTPAVTEQMIDRAARSLAREVGEEDLALDIVTELGYRESAREALSAALNATDPFAPGSAAPAHTTNEERDA